MKTPMRTFLAALLAAFALPQAAHAGFRLTVRTVPVGTNIDWSYAQNRDPVRYRSGGVDLTLRGRPDADSPDLIRPILTVAVPGFAPVQAEGADTPESFDHRVTVGRWDAERPYVLFQSYSGGAHCCTQVQVIYPEDGRLQVVDLGEWDSGYWDDLPTDRNGDGRLDFEFVDNGFLYAFASYAESSAPPLIINVVGGRAVDVSRHPGFRPLYERAMAAERQACLHPQDGRSPNGACAAFVAAAARVGRFDRAWAEMLQDYDRDSDWELPSSCRAALVDYRCPEGQEVTFDNYPDALRFFLVEHGYLDG
jgi:hypothetical protein